MNIKNNLTNLDYIYESNLNNKEKKNINVNMNMNMNDNVNMNKNDNKNNYNNNENNYNNNENNNNNNENNNNNNVNKYNNHNNIKIKLKYKLDKIKPDEIKLDQIKNYFGYDNTINCSYEFLIYKFGKSLESTIDGKSKGNWIIKIKASNQQIYYLHIYDFKEHEKKLEDITNWYINCNESTKIINYDKICKLIEFEYKQYLKKIEKKNKEFEKKFNNKKNNIIKNSYTNTNSITNTNTNTNTKYIDEEKYNKINLELDKYSDDDLASVLFVRFKNSSNFLLKQALIIHRTLIDPINYNKKSFEKKILNEKKNFADNKNIIIKKNKSKYNKKILF